MCGLGKRGWESKGLECKKLQRTGDELYMYVDSGVSGTATAACTGSQDDACGSLMQMRG